MGLRGWCCEIVIHGTNSLAQILVLERKALDFLELAPDHGVDPKWADPDAVSGTYKRVLIDRFRDLGNNLTRERTLASYRTTTLIHLNVRKTRVGL